MFTMAGPMVSHFLPNGTKIFKYSACLFSVFVGRPTFSPLWLNLFLRPVVRQFSLWLKTTPTTPWLWGNLSPPRLYQPARCRLVIISFTGLLAVRFFVFVLPAFQPTLRKLISFLFSCSKTFLHHGRFTVFTGSPSSPAWTRFSLRGFAGSSWAGVL